MSVNRLLYLGCEVGQDVMDLQDRLNALRTVAGVNSALSSLEVDGVFGPRTLARVQELQRQTGLSVDGIVGPTVWHALATLHGSVPGMHIGLPVGGAGHGIVKSGRATPLQKMKLDFMPAAGSGPANLARGTIQKDKMRSAPGKPFTAPAWDAKNY
jgi:hypothetical protein